jgi:hypothetical protein
MIVLLPTCEIPLAMSRAVVLKATPCLVSPLGRVMVMGVSGREALAASYRGR